MRFELPAARVRLHIAEAKTWECELEGIFVKEKTASDENSLHCLLPTLGITIP